jgi:hypothetical protein
MVYKLLSDECSYGYLASSISRLAINHMSPRLSTHTTHLTAPEPSPSDQRARAAAELATYMRQHLNRTPAQPPAVDGWLATAIGWGAGGVLSAILIAYAWVDLRPRPKTQPVMAIVAGERLTVPVEWMGPQADPTLGDDHLVRLRFSWPDLGRAQMGSPDTIHVTLSPADQTNDPAKQLVLWSRFLSSTAWSNPGGLVLRQFRKNTPFENDELYVSVPDGRDFAALCPLDRNGPEEPCRVRLRHGPFDMAVRLPRDALAQWETLVPALKAKVDAIRR